MKAVVAAFNQEKALVGAFSVITNLRMDLFEALLETKRSKCWPSGCGVCGKLRFWSKIKLGKTLLIKTGRFRQPLALLVHYCLAASAISLHFGQNHIHFCPNYTNFSHKFDFPPHIAPVVPENRSACGRGQYSSLKCKLLSMTVVNFSYICKTLK